MTGIGPLVTIGIPTYNRANLIARSIESALNQDYKNIEVIVSDNASTDETESVCRGYCAQDGRLKYIRQPENCGPTANFRAVLDLGAGEFFMWLGDDDWIDPDYITLCAQVLINDASTSLVSGVPEYYRDGKNAFVGKIFSLQNDAWWLRVILYYAKVTDNGLFYGLMRMSQLRPLVMPNLMGGDWHLISNVVALGKAKMRSEISVHRELGGTSASHQRIATTLGLPRIQATFPAISIAAGAWVEITQRGVAFRQQSAFARRLVGAAVILAVLSRAVLRNLRQIFRWLRGQLWERAGIR